jgi:ferredoxin
MMNECVSVLACYVLASQLANTSTRNAPTRHMSEKKRKISKIIVDRDQCIGAAPCITVAPGVFRLDEENKAYVVDMNAADDDTILLAAQSCPVQAISLFDEEGRQIYP